MTFYRILSTHYLLQHGGNFCHILEAMRIIIMLNSYAKFGLSITRTPPCSFVTSITRRTLAED